MVDSDWTKGTKGRSGGGPSLCTRPSAAHNSGPFASIPQTWLCSLHATGRSMHPSLLCYEPRCAAQTLQEALSDEVPLTKRTHRPSQAIRPQYQRINAPSMSPNTLGFLWRCRTTYLYSAALSDLDKCRRTERVSGRHTHQV